MIVISHDHTDGFFNAALEQYLLHEFEDDIFMLWRNKNAVVMGKHQVAYKEVNYPYVTENDVQVVRRITGGGTVYHDLGNINFTFIDRIADKEKMIDFKRYLVPMQAALSRLGLEVEITKTNDLTLEGKKISGNAAHVFNQQQKIIHHGTLLYNSDLKTLGRAIKEGKGKYDSKGVNSNRSTVTCIADHMSDAPDIEHFMNLLAGEILRDKNVSHYFLKPDDIKKVEALRDEKFIHWNWNYGYSPKYSLSRENAFEMDGSMLQLEVKQGEILSASFDHNGATITLNSLVGKQHNPNDIEPVWSDLEKEIGSDLKPEYLLHFFD